MSTITRLGLMTGYATKQANINSLLQDAGLGAGIGGLSGFSHGVSANMLADMLDKDEDDPMRPSTARSSLTGALTGAAAGAGGNLASNYAARSIPTVNRLTDPASASRTVALSGLLGAGGAGTLAYLLTRQKRKPKQPVKQAGFGRKAMIDLLGSKGIAGSVGRGIGGAADAVGNLLSGRRGAVNATNMVRKNMHKDSLLQQIYQQMSNMGENADGSLPVTNRIWDKYRRHAQARYNIDEAQLPGMREAARAMRPGADAVSKHTLFGGAAAGAGAGLAGLGAGIGSLFGGQQQQ